MPAEFTPTVVEVGKDATDIPRVMRSVADAIEAGEYGDVQFVGAVLIRRENQPPEVFGWGHVGNLELIGAFQIAHHWMLKPR